MKKILKNCYLLKLVIVALTLFSTAAEASQSPRFLGSEKKFRSYIYNPNDVYHYLGHYNYQGFIEFALDETISTISMGDSSAWLFEHLGNRLFLKPVADNASTNMTVITNKKIYHFELVAKEAKNIDDPNLIFVVKFVYPDEKDKNIMQFSKSPLSDEPDMRNLKIYNFNYEFTGEPSLAPLKVFDNAEFTYFQFADKSAEIPAIFTVDSAGFESLVNFRSAGNYIIVERIAPQFTLRNGNEIVCVYNNNLLKSGKTAAPGQKRPKSKKDVSPLSFENASPFVQPAPYMPSAPGSAPGPNVNYGSQNLPNMNNLPDNNSYQSGPQTAINPPPSFEQAVPPFGANAPSRGPQQGGFVTPESFAPPGPNSILPPNAPQPQYQNRPNSGQLLQ